MRSDGFPFIVWGSGGWTLVRVVLLGSSREGLGACVWTFRVAGVGDRGSACAALDRGLAFRVAGDARERLGGRWAVDSLGRCGESCVLTLLRVRFAWQVWGMVAIGAAARVIGVGNGVICCVAGHRFAWQAQGIVHGR